MTRNPCIGWANGDPVTFPKPDGSVRALGKVVIFRSKRTQHWTCKVQLQTAGSGLGRYGQWVWPEGWVIGQGPIAGKCLECSQEYRTKERGAGFCLACDRRFTREVNAHSGIRSPLRYLHGAITPRPRPKPITEADAKAIAAVKERDEQESPY